jgi:hypothetical protein
MTSLEDYTTQTLTGRNRRLLHEWQAMDKYLSKRGAISYEVNRRNAEGLPTGYLITYRIKSICGIKEDKPVFAPLFRMQIDIPAAYPCVDAMPSFHFLTRDEAGTEIPHPWHPNIRFFGPLAGRVCLNLPDTYADLAWAVLRVADYLNYDLYHAINEPPFPEDLRVAQWVIQKGEPNGWINWTE